MECSKRTCRWENFVLAAAMSVVLRGAMLAAREVIALDSRF